MRGPPPPLADLRLPPVPTLVAGPREILWVSPEGEIDHPAPEMVAARVRTGGAPLVCHGPATARRLGIRRFRAFDALELFAFVHPARFAVPTPRGLAAALDLPHADAPGRTTDVAALHGAVARLLAELRACDETARREAAPVAEYLAAVGWTWGPAVLAALGLDPAAVPHSASRRDALAVWDRLDEWSEEGPPPPAGHMPVEPAEARRRLAELLSTPGGDRPEDRPEQADFASAVAAAFRPRTERDAPTVVLAEAGTGVGKTLGYLAPATVWAEKNRGAVWISTYTKNLQQQLDAELDRLYPDPGEKARKVVIRKGRENYLCLLNLEEAAAAAGAPDAKAEDRVGLALVARWAAHTRNGDLVGGDFPTWLADIAGWRGTMGLLDRRGECVYSACPHYHKCFIEKSIRGARRARVVVANHALVMIQAALGGEDETRLPTRYVFDEGHHLFDAADSAFSAHLGGRETADLRRWLVGGDGRQRSRARGLRRRVDDLVSPDPAAREALERVVDGARALAGEGWLRRIAEGTPRGPTEAFLAHVRRQVLARARDADGPYSLETETRPPNPGLIEAAAALDAALARLEEPLEELRGRLLGRLEREAAELDSPTRRRIEAMAGTIARRGLVRLSAWRAMLAALSAETPPEYLDWLMVERDGRGESDVALCRHWIDPMIPFAETVLRPAHGVVVTSASLRDGTGDVEADWAAAEARTGTRHLPVPALRAAVPSPFDYRRLTRIYIVTDVRRDSAEQTAAAYRELFLASGGGALGLFTAINRLRAVHSRIVGPLEEAGLRLLAQHVDGFDVATLVDIFRAERDTCLLGTDAVRDGVDVPGPALRLAVFDRVPWPRPDLLHRARRDVFGGRLYDDMIARFRLRQAYGRLVRRAEDVGVFVLLDPAMPSRLLGAFPEGVDVQRVGLAEAVAGTRAFLAGSGDDGAARRPAG